jgi:hypothetical protein
MGSTFFLLIPFVLPEGTKKKARRVGNCFARG